MAIKNSIRRGVGRLAPLALLFGLALPAQAFAVGPVLDIAAESYPTNVAPGDRVVYRVFVDNVGEDDATGPIKVTAELPDGVTFTQFSNVATYWDCSEVPELECTIEIANRLDFSNILPAHATTPYPIEVLATVDPGTPEGNLEASFTASGGGAGDDTQIVETAVTEAPAPFGVASLSGRLTNPDGSPARQAGSHPDFTTTLTINTAGRDDFLGGLGVSPVDNLNDTDVELPPGLVGNPTVLPTCEPGDVNGPENAPLCPPQTQVGTVAVTQSRTTFYEALYNVVPPPGVPARFAFNASGVVVNLDPKLRSDGDYGLDVHVGHASVSLPVHTTRVTFWGVPADPTHAIERRFPNSNEIGAPSDLPRRPFMSMPTSCPDEDLEVRGVATSWASPPESGSASFTADTNGEPIRVEGCNQIDFNPTIEARPTTNLADSPSGLDVKIRVPQNEDPDGYATAHVKDVTLTLPEGMTVNPSSANGLGACSPQQIGLTSPVGQADARFDEAPVACPDDSKLGTVRIDTPLLEDPLHGAIYLATPHQNPFGSLLGLYIAVEDPRVGVKIKLAGQPVPDPQTGRLEVTFAQNPQLPFEDLTVNMFSGPRAALKTPLRCGQLTTTSQIVPWSSPEGATKTPSDQFALDKGAGGAPCVGAESQAPHRPTLSAGTVDPAAGAFSPFVLRVTREDGTQPLQAIEASLPKGLLARLAGVSYCPEESLAAAAQRPGKAEQAAPSCPLSSRVGGVEVGAGAGSNPLYVKGEAYLAGPYKGAPLSLAIVTPAIGGPFDLGTVVVRTALHVQPETVAIRAVSDPIPTILQGIPLDIRSIAVNIDRPGFTLNPTNCSPMTVGASALSTFGQSAAMSSRFQVGGCRALGFKPKLALRLKGGTKRSDYPALTATLTARPGDANIGSAVVALPRSEFLAQNHIRTVCTRVQFAADACPPGSVYGSAQAVSPLLDQPLEGPVYLRSSSNPLPDLVADLRGQIRVALVGRIDSVRGGGIRTSFDAVPDAPVTKFVLRMQGGKKGLLENSRNICKGKQRANVRMVGQNGRVHEFRPVMRARCKGKKGEQGKRGKGNRDGR